MPPKRRAPAAQNDKRIKGDGAEEVISEPKRSKAEVSAIPAAGSEAKEAATQDTSTKDSRTMHDEKHTKVAEPAATSTSSAHVIDGPEAEAYLCDENKEHLEEGLAVLRIFSTSTSKLFLRWPGTESKPLHHACEVLLANNGAIARKVTHLRLANGTVDPTQGKKLLAAMPHLISLELCFCHFANPEKGVTEFLAGLEKAALAKLHLTFSIDGSALPAVLVYLAAHKTVSDLDLMGAHIGDKDVEGIVATLKKRGAPLRNLGLASNDLKSASAASLLVAVADDLQLENLDLNQNKFTAEVALAIAAPLAKNKSIRVLRMSVMKLGVRGATAIIEACLSRPGGVKSIDRLTLDRIGLSAFARTKLEARMPDPPLEL